MKLPNDMYIGVPQDSISAFVMLRDLQHSPEAFDNRIILELQNTIDNLITVDSISCEESMDLTKLIGKKKLKELLRNGKCSLR